MFVIIGVILLVVWLLGITVLHITGGFIHLLVILAVISVVAHFFRGRGTV